ncbi:MAG: hypothetical protein JWP63_2805 [Candidatus Solibacter sp.]|jgi:hypothetical protein|nr:hypothetical protein [Candidatus Solibacter sp.]
MHTVLILEGGRRVDALLLSASPDRLRVAIPGRGDAVEYRMIDGQWRTDRGGRVEIGALLVADGMSPSYSLPQTHARTLGAT